MTVHRARMAVMATVLAFIAVLGMGTLGGWHAATFYDDAPTHAVIDAHLQGGDAPDDTPVHVAAHAVGHVLDVRAHAGPFIRPAEIATAWPTCDSTGRVGAGPASLLRPPRA